MVDISVKMRIEGILYNQYAHNNDIKTGDLVFDTKDNTFGFCDMVHPDNKHIVIKSDYVAEVGVPMDRVRLLKPAIETNSLN